MKKWRKYVYASAMFVILGLTVGFAALVSEMSISNLVAEVRAKADIRISEVSFVSEQSSNVTSNNLNYSVNSIISNVTFSDSSSYITYKIKVTNIGSVEMGVLEITGLHEDLTYTLTDYNLEDKICDSSNNCSLGISKEFYIKIYPSTDDTPITYDMKLTFDFQPFNTITYDGITNNGYPTEIINGGDLVVTFTDPVPSSISIYLDNLEVDTNLYTYENSILTYNDVTGNIVIKGPKTLYSIMQMATNGVDTNIDFGSASSETNGDGVNTISGTEDDEYPIYYYRGAVTNNNVIFAGFCWKMVRTTELGGVKLIYNGSPAEDGSCANTGTASQIGITVFNEEYDTVDYVRYICADGTDSTIKGAVDTWYTSNMTAYTSQLEDTPWCNDRSVVSESAPIYFGAYDRLKTNKLPSLECESDYQLTVASPDADKHLKYPVALLTADEIIFAGSKEYDGGNVDVYLNTGQRWWSLSPYFYSPSGDVAAVFVSGQDGTLGASGGGQSGVRPAVSLVPGTKIAGGDGSASNPYTVDIPLITFYIDDVAYQAIDGMTWEFWISSEYNYSGFQIYGSDSVADSHGYYVMTNGIFSAPFSATLEIIENYKYIVYNEPETEE